MKLASNFNKSILIGSTLSGILIGFAYIPFPPLTNLFCIVPLWWCWWQAKSLRQVLWASWWTQFLLTIIGFHWIAHTAYEFGHLPLMVSWLILFAFAAFANWYLIVAGALWFSWKAWRPASQPTLIFRLVILTFLSETFLPSIFPWNFGYPWMATPLLPFRQLAEWIGFQGLSGLVLSIQGCLFAAYLAATLRKKLTYACFAVFIFVTANILGLLILKNLPETMQKQKFLVIQANIGNYEKYMAEQGDHFQAAIAQKYFSQTQSALQKLANQLSSNDLVVWPETAFPSLLGPLDDQRAGASSLFAFIREVKFPLLAGTYERDLAGDIYNSIALLNSNGEKLSSYRKTNLLAFGEYIPGRDHFPAFARLVHKLVPEISEFGHGSGPTVLTFNNVKLGAQICYEGLFPSFSRELAALDTQIFVNVTNDSWFGVDFEPEQHMYMTLARAIEFRTPLLRSTNTGISTAVTATGEILEKSPTFQEWSHIFEVPYYTTPQKTFYSRFGYFLPHVLLLLAFLTAGLNWYRRKK